MELFNFYSLDECLNRKSVKKTLTSLQKDGKIDYSQEFFKKVANLTVSGQLAV